MLIKCLYNTEYWSLINISVCQSLFTYIYEIYAGRNLQLTLILIPALLMAWVIILGSCAQHGYRSNGVYVDGWFGGRCGSGHPFYLMCPDCRERYLEVRGNRENLQHSADVSDSQSSLRAPDLLDYIEQAYSGNV